MPNYNRKGPEGEGPRTGRKLGKSNPENRGLSEEEIAQNNANKSRQHKGRGRNDEETDDRGKRDGSGKGRGRKDGRGKGRGRKDFGGRKPGRNRRHQPNN